MARRCSCVAKVGISSLRTPVSRFTTPPGRSLVASISPKRMLGYGCVVLASATTLFPLVIAGKISDSRPKTGASSGARMPTMPIGSVTVKLKCAEATGFTLPSTCSYLSVQPA
jgi:hypothetical protein